MAEEYDGTKPMKVIHDPPTIDEVQAAGAVTFDADVEEWLKGMKMRVFSKIEPKNPITGEDEPPGIVGRICTTGKIALSKPGTVGRERSENAKFVRSKATFHAVGVLPEGAELAGRMLARHDLGKFLTEHKAEFAGMEVY